MGERLKYRFAWVPTLLAVVCSACFVEAAPLPALSLKDLSGKEQSLSDYHGRIVVLNFWATWCVPCREELPMLNKLAEKYAEKGVVFLAASIDDPSTQPKIAPFLEKKKVTMPVFVGSTVETLKQLDLGGIVPATIILDENGEVISRIMGEAESYDITGRLNWLLNGRPGKPPKPVLKTY